MLAHPLLKSWNNEVSPVDASNLCYPIFICEGENEKQEIKAMPEQFRWGVNR